MLLVKSFITIGKLMSTTFMSYLLQTKAVPLRRPEQQTVSRNSDKTQPNTTGLFIIP